MFPITFMSTLYYALINRITFLLITSHKWELNHVNPPAKTHSPHSVNYSDWTSHFEPRVAKFLCGSGSCIIIHKSVCFTCMLFPINFQCTFIRNNWEESTYIYIYVIPFLMWPYTSSQGQSYTSLQLIDHGLMIVDDPMGHG